MIFAEGKTIRRSLVQGDSLELVPVGENEFIAQEEDPHAVRVCVPTEKPTVLGWIPKTHSRMVRQLLENEALWATTVHWVGTDERGLWRISIVLHYSRPNEEEIRLRKIVDRMAVPSPEYAKLIAAAALEGSEAESDWIDVYNATCFDVEA